MTLPTRTRKSKPRKARKPTLVVPAVSTESSNNTASRNVEQANVDKALPSLLSVKQLSGLLQINEKKVYQLAADGEIPGTKVTGKWLFPTQMVLDWIEQHSHGGARSDRLLLVGADDLLLDRVCRRLTLDLGRSGILSYNPCGSMHGLRLLAARKADGCFFHWGISEENNRRQLGLLRSFREHPQWVTLRCLYRRECLVFSPDCFNRLEKQLSPLVAAADLPVIPKTLETLLQLLTSQQLEWAQRHHESGTQRLLEDISDQFGMRPESLGSTISYYAGERETAVAVAHNQADVALTSEAVAREYGLHFVTIGQVAIDLVLSRKTYFQPLVQTLVKRLPQTDGHIQHHWSSAYELPANPEISNVKPL